MTIETQVADLQTSVTALLTAVNVKKSEMDAAVTLANQALTAAMNIPTITNTVELQNARNDAAASASAALTSRNQAVAAAALYPSITGQGTNIPRVNAGATAMEFRTPTQFRTDLGLSATGAVTFGSLSLGPVVTKTADFTLAATENYVINNKASVACVMTLPAASAHSGRILNLVNGPQGTALNSASANVIPITGAAAGTAVLPAGTGNWVSLVSNGTNWVVVASGKGNGLLVIGDLNPSAVRLSSEGYLSITDNELATIGWAKGYADTAVTGLLVSNLAPTAIRVLSEGYASLQDTELPTTAWVNGFLDNFAGLDVANFSAAAVRTSAESIVTASDTEFPTVSWVQAYVRGTPYRFTSAQQTITINTTLTVAHGLGAKPTDVELTAICLTAQAPHAVNDETQVTGVIVTWDATNIYIRTSAAVNSANATGAALALTVASWRYIVRAR